MAGVRGGREKGSSSAKRDRGGRWSGENWGGNACLGAIVFFVFYVQILDAKITIGQMDKRAK